MQSTRCCGNLLHSLGFSFVGAHWHDDDDVPASLSRSSRATSFRFCAIADFLLSSFDLPSIKIEYKWSLTLGHDFPPSPDYNPSLPLVEFGGLCAWLGVIGFIFVECIGMTMFQIRRGDLEPILFVSVPSQISFCHLLISLSMKFECSLYNLGHNLVQSAIVASCAIYRVVRLK